MLTEGRNHRITDMLKTVYPLKLHYAEGINMGFSSTQGQVTLMWLEAELIQDFMAVLVTCKIDEDWIKSEVISPGQHCLHYKAMGKYFIDQGQVTSKKIV